MAKMPKPNTNVRGTVNERPADGFGIWQYSDLPFQTLVSNSKDSSVSNPPFKGVDMDGSLEWQKAFHMNYPNGIKGNRLKAIDHGMGTQSGSFHFMPGDNWQMAFYISTDNWYWFEDEVTGSNVDYFHWDGDDSFANEMQNILDSLTNDNWPVMGVEKDDWDEKSRAVFILSGDSNDYISVDVDSEDSSIAQFRIRLDGEQFMDNDEVDEDVWLTLLWARYWDETYEWPDEKPPLDDECPEGYEWDEEAQVCVLIEEPPEPPTKTCPPGYVYDAELGICVKENIPQCQDGYEWNPTTQQCEKIGGGGGGGGDDDTTFSPWILIIVLGGVLWLGLILSRGRK